MRTPLAIVALLAWAPALADTTTLHGDSLALSTGSDSTVNVEPDSSLSHAVRVTSDASCRGVQTQGTVVSISTDTCENDSGSMVVAVPPGFSVTVTSHGDGNIRVGNTQGPLNVTLAGGGDLVAGNVGPLTLTIRGSGNATASQVSDGMTLEVTGSGDVRVRQMDGPLHSIQRGSGDLAIGAITAPMADLTIEGSGDALLGTGRIGTLTAQVRGGSANLGVSAVVGDARVSAYGGGDVKLGEVTGRLEKSVGGGSDVYVGAGLASAGLGKLAEVISNPANDSDAMVVRDGSNTIVVHRGSGGNAAWHVISAVIVIGLLVLLWRTVRRRGGIAAMQARMRAPASPAAATHPGVIAVRDTVTRLDGRLAKLESYVTSREFDLHRKFRELDTQ